MSIHPTALVADDAQIGEDVTIGPFSIVSDGTVIGDRCTIGARVEIRAGTTLGTGNLVESGAILGGDPQFMGFDRETPSGVRIGNDNIFREYVTVHRSIEDGGATTIGDENYLMTAAHVGHDSHVGNQNVFANNVLLGGHVEVGDHCFFGGAAVFHQFVRVGDYVMAQGMAGTSLDIAPYLILACGANSLAGINVVGLRRAGFDPSERALIKQAYSLIFRQKLPLSEARARLEPESLPKSLDSFFGFLEGPSRKGICKRLREDA